MKTIILVTAISLAAFTSCSGNGIDNGNPAGQSIENDNTDSGNGGMDESGSGGNYNDDSTEMDVSGNGNGTGTMNNP